MGWKPTAKHRMLNHMVGNAATGAVITQASLHSAFPATDANELAGGSPAYARKAVAFEAVAGTETEGSVDASGSPVASFDIPGGSTIAAIAFRSADGTIQCDVDKSGSPEVTRSERRSRMQARHRHLRPTPSPLSAWTRPRPLPEVAG